MLLRYLSKYLLLVLEPVQHRATGGMGRVPKSMQSHSASIFELKHR